MSLDKKTLTRQAKQLLTLAQGLMRSGSRFEDDWWEAEIFDFLQNLFDKKDPVGIERLLDDLINHCPDSYETLVDLIETKAESHEIEHNGKTYHALLFSAPILLWTRYQLPMPILSEQQVESLNTLLAEHIVAPDAHVLMVPRLLTLSDMPKTFYQTHYWAQQLAEYTLDGNSWPPSAEAQASQVRHAEGALADVRFLTGIVVTAKDAPLFRWQTTQSSQAHQREIYQDLWETKCHEILGPNLAGCQVEYLHPDAYHTNNREADHRIRPIILRAATLWLSNTAAIPSHNLRAFVAGCGDQTIQEYRIGFASSDDATIIYGCIWPLLSRHEAVIEMLDSDGPTATDQIAEALIEEGITEVKRLPGVLPPDYCEDCGTPLFPDSRGVLKHPRLPDDLCLEPIVLH